MSLSPKTPSTESGKVARQQYLDLAKRVTGEVHHVDSGFNVVGMPQWEDLQAEEAAQKKNAAE